MGAFDEYGRSEAAEEKLPQRPPSSGSSAFAEFGSPAPDTAWDRAKRIVSEDIPRLLTSNQPSVSPAAPAIPEESVLAASEAVPAAAEPVPAASTPPPVVSVPPAQPVEAAGPLSRARQVMERQALESKPFQAERLPSAIREIGSRQDVMGIATPQDKEFAKNLREGIQPFITKDIPNLAKTYGARIGSGLEMALGGALQMIDYIGRKREGEDPSLDEMMKSPIFKKGADLFAEGKAIEGTIEEEAPMLTRPGKWGAGVVSSVGQMLPSIAIGAATRSPAAGLAAMYPISAGGEFGERTSQAKPMDEALLSAEWQGITEVGTETLPFLKMAKFLKPGKLGKKIVEYLLADVPGEIIATALQRSGDVYFDEKDPTKREQQVKDYLSSHEFVQEEIDTIFITFGQAFALASPIAASRVIARMAGGQPPKEAKIDEPTAPAPPKKPKQPKKEAASAAKEGIQPEGDILEHPGTGGVGPAAEAVGGDRTVQREKTPVAEEGKEVTEERRTAPRPALSGLREDQITDLSTVDSDIGVAEFNLDAMKKDYEAKKSVPGKEGTLARADITDRMNRWNDSLGALKKRRDEILEGTPPKPITIEPPVPAGRAKTPAQVAFEEERAARKPIPRTGELRPEPHEVSEVPVSPPGDRWTGDRGAIPGEPSHFLDGDAETAKAALVEVPQKEGEAVWEARDAEGKAIGQFSNLEDAAKAAEVHVDKLPVKTEGEKVQVSSNAALTKAQGFNIGDTVYFRTGFNKEPQKITHIDSEGNIRVEGSKATRSPTEFTKRLFKGLPVDKPGKELTDADMDILTAPEARAMSERNRDLGKHESDPRFLVSLKPGEIGYQTNLPPHLQPVTTDYRLVRDFLKDGTLPERGKELQKIADRYRAIDDKISEVAAIKSAAMVRTAIERGAYNSMLHPSNKISRNIFYEITGVKLPTGVGATQKLFTLKPFEKKAAWLKGKETIPVVDGTLSPDLEYQRFVEELTPEQKETAKSWIMKNPRNPKGQIEQIKKVLKNAEVLESEDFKKASEAAGKMPEGMRVEVPGVEETPADPLDALKQDLENRGAGRVGDVDYRIIPNNKGNYEYEIVKKGVRETVSTISRKGMGYETREDAIREAIARAKLENTPLSTEKKPPTIEVEGGPSDAGGTGKGVREEQLLDGPPSVAPGEQAAVREKDVLQGPVETSDVPVPESGAGDESVVQPPGKGPAPKRDRRDSVGAGAVAAPAGERAGAVAGVPEVVDHPVGREPVRIEDRNHVIASGDIIVPAGKVSRINANIKALELSRKLEAENRNPSPEEKKVLAQFSGWGSLAQDVFDFDRSIAYDRDKNGTLPSYAPGDAEKYRKWFERVGKKLHPDLGGILSKEEWEAAKASTLNAHYTSREVITQGLWSIAERLGIKGGRIVEPSAGIGHIIGLMPESIARRAVIQAVELDKTSGDMLKRLYPEANVQITGFQNARAMKDNSADLVISNFPFGNYPVTDPKHKDYSGWSIHNYFFARSIDLARPGGIVIGITSHYTLDATGGGKMRDYLAKKADFVGAVRLPSTAFDKSAGTEVVTDIIVFRKKDASQFAGAEPFRNVLNIETAKGENAPVNEYFVNHPEMVLGEHSMKGTMYGGGGKEYTLLPGKEPLGEALAKAVSQFPAAVAGEGALVSRQETIFAEAGEKNGILLEKDGKLYVNDGGELVRPDFAKYATRVIAAKRYIGVRNHAKELIRLQLDEATEDVEIVKQREKLNKVYDDFVKRHGWISDRSNQWLSEDGDYPLALSLERQVDIPKKYEVKSGPNKGQTVTGKERTFVKTAIFTERTIFPFKEPASADSAEDAVKISMTYRNKVDAAYIAKLLNGTVESVTEKLTNDGLAYVNPATGLLEGQDDYLSGNVRDKLIRAQEAVKDDPLFEKNVEALKRVQPKDLEIDQIYMRIGSTWVPPEAYTDFIKDTLGMKIGVSYRESADNSKFFMDNPRHGLSALAQNTWGVEGANALELMKDSFDLKFPEIKANVGTHQEPKWVVLEKETIAAREMQKKLQAEFLSWTRKSQKWAPALKDIYNRDKNNMVLKTAHTPTMKHYPGASHSITLHPHQKRAVARSLQESTLLAHAVGTGKTYIFATTAMEMRRIGTAKKPMIVVQGSTLNQYARAFRELYPTARVLIPNTRQLQAKNRKKLLAQIATGDWDAVVLQHSTYDMFSVKPEKEAAYVQEQIAELEAIIKDMEARGEDKRTVKQWEKLKKKKEEKIVALLARGRKEGMLNFDDLGIDALLVDEAHKYKRSEFYTKMDRIKGIDSGSAGRSMLHLLKTAEVRGRTGGKNVIIATGTPISNTMAELWTHLRYIRPDLMEAYGVTSFDAFAANFGNVKTELEETMTTDFKEVSRFAEYVNGPELLTMWRTAADVIMAEDVNVVRPTIKGGAPRQIMLERPAELASFIQGIKLQKQAWDKLSGKEKRDSRHVPLVLFGLAKKAAIDLRLVDASRPDIPGSKVNKVVEESLQVWKDTKELKAAQVIFSDLYQSPDGKFNLFEDIKKKLIKGGVPASEIAIIHDFKNDEAREALFAKVNDGDVRFVMGGTEKLGVGVNIQERLVRAHHLDIPGRPMDFEQRNGRIWRPGNTIDTIDITTYGHKATMDSVAAQRLQTKQKFINQVLRGDLQDRTFEDPFDPAQGTFEDMMASFGNPKVREKFGLESQIRNLKALKSSHENEVGRARTTIWQNDTGIKRREEDAKEWESAIKELDKAFPDGKVSEFNLPDAGGAHDRDSFVKYFSKVSEELHARVKSRFEGVSKDRYYELRAKGEHLPPVYAGTVNGLPFRLRMEVQTRFALPWDTKSEGVAEVGDTEIWYQLFDKKKSDDLGANRTVNTARGVMSSIETFIRNAHDRPKELRESGAHLARQNKDLAELLDKPFEHEADLADKERRLIEVEVELKAAPVEDLSKTPADEIDLTALSGLPAPEGVSLKKEIGSDATPEAEWWEGKVLGKEDIADAPTMPKRYFIVTGEGFKEVKGHFVNIEEGVDTFASLFPGTRRWNVSEGKTGLRIESGDTREDAVANARKRVADLPGGSLSKWMEEHASEAVEKQERGYSPRYGKKPEGAQTETPPKKTGILGSEEGFLDVAFLMPGIEAGKDVRAGITSLILPTAKSAEHLRTAEVLGAKLGSSHRDAEIASKALDKDSRAFDKMGVNDPKSDLTTNPGIKFMSDMSQGRTMTPDLQRIADKVKNLFDDRLRKLEVAGAGLRTVRENYFPGMWTDKTTATAFLSKRPLKGKESFRKQKVFDDIMEGIEAGLVPISNNPIDLVKLKLAEMDRSIMANRALREWEKKGDVAELPYNKPMPEGWAKINDKYGTVWGPPSVPVWRILREMARGVKKDLYFAEFGKEVFPSGLEVAMGADDTMKQEANGLEWTGKGGKAINIHAMRRGTGRSYSQLIIEKLLEDHDAFEEQAPTIYKRLQEIADTSPKIREILAMPTFQEGLKLPVGGWVNRGSRIAKKPVADILNNFLSSSIYNSPYFGTAFKAYMGMANLLNQSQLGVGSGFHAGFTSADVQISHNAEVIKDIYGILRGNRTVKDLAKTLKKVPAAIITNPRRGAKVLREWRTPTLEVPTNVPVEQLPQTSEARVAMIARAAELAGGAFRLERGLRTEWTEKQMREWYGNQKFKAATRSPVVAVELFAKPIMEWLVPRQKAGVFGELVGRIIEQNPGKTMEQLIPQFRQAWNRVDARLGQVVYDRLFINNMAKNVIQGAIRAPGWTGGTIGEIGGAPKDLVKFFAEWKRTGKAPEDIPDRVAYVVALLTTVAVANGLLTYAFTGDDPEGMDWWAFRTSGYDEYGKAERFILPTYAKDLFAWYQDWGHTLIAKTHPIWGLVGDIWRNRDYYGVKIYNEDDPFLARQLDKVIHIGKAFEPFWIRGAKKGISRGGGFAKTITEEPQKVLAPQLGIMPATSAYTKTPFEKFASKTLEERRPRGTRTKEEAEHTNRKREIEQGLRRGDSGAEDELQAAMASGEITRIEAQNIKRRSKEDITTKIAKSMTLEDLAAGIPLASDREKALIKPIFQKKIQNKTGEIDGKTRDKYIDIFRAM